MGVALCMVTTATLAKENWPTRPVKFLVPSPPGGPADMFARLFAAHCATVFSAPFIVENRPGATGSIASQALARSPADGTTFLIGSNSTFVLTPLLQKHPGYDPARDFAPVGTFTSYPALLLGRRELPFSDVAELVAHARNHPGRLNYASFGLGSLGHLANEYLCHLTGVRVTHVNYPGTMAVLQALAKGEADYAFDSYGNARGLVDAGKIVPLAIASTQRDPRMPNVASMAESGFPQMDLRIWIGFVAPAGTRRDIVSRLNAELKRFAELPETRQRLEAGASDLDTGSPEAMAQRLNKERVFWTSVVKDAKVVVE
jgi:tripartite-type tricarboxylate transporter receptor subunit TctC